MIKTYKNISIFFYLVLLTSCVSTEQSAVLEPWGLDKFPAVIYSPTLIMPKGVDRIQAALHVKINSDGTAELIRIVSLTYQPFEKYLDDFVSQTKFEPPTKSGKPTSQEFIWPLDFNFKKKQERWDYNATRADGYTIDFVDADPKPGEKLIAGSVVTFKVKARYLMSVADKGSVVLVFQNRTGQSIEGTTPQTSIGVVGPSGDVELSRVVTIPTKTDFIRLFIPLVPDGFKQTYGEIVINYPIIEN